VIALECSGVITYARGDRSWALTICGEPTSIAANSTSWKKCRILEGEPRTHDLLIRISAIAGTTSLLTMPLRLQAL